MPVTNTRTCILHKSIDNTSNTIHPARKRTNAQRDGRHAHLWVKAATYLIACLFLFQTLFHHICFPFFAQGGARVKQQLLLLHTKKIVAPLPYALHGISTRRNANRLCWTEKNLLSHLKTRSRTWTTCTQCISHGASTPATRTLDRASCGAKVQWWIRRSCKISFSKIIDDWSGKGPEVTKKITDDKQKSSMLPFPSRNEIAWQQRNQGHTSLTMVYISLQFTTKHPVSCRLIRN